MTQEEINAQAREAVLKYDVKGAKAVAQKAIDEGVDIVSVIQDGFTTGITEVGELYEAKKLFLPHIMAAANAMNAGVDILTPEIEKSGASVGEGLGTFVICTIEGDIHSIGKDIVAIMLK
ncbi:MAG: B12-binding domain-containing protein, partial [Candidatus Methanomethylophilaceae archaeon]